MNIRVGIGSWADSAYTGVLYPPGLAPGKRLATYAEWFDQVEVNSTYYAAPRTAVVTQWGKQTPPHFQFNLKLHRAISQSPRRAATEGKLVGLFKRAAEPLVRSRKFGAFLLVLPPGFSPARHRLTELDPLVEKLRPHRLAVELRHSDWVGGGQRAQTLAYFRAQGLVWVAVDMPRVKDPSFLPAVDVVTNPTLAYLRLHGRNSRWLQAESAAERHTYRYGERALREIVARVRQLAAQAAEVHVIVNTHSGDLAPRAALALRKLLRLPVRR